MKLIRPHLPTKVVFIASLGLKARLTNNVIVCLESKICGLSRWLVLISSGPKSEIDSININYSLFVILNTYISLTCNQWPVLLKSIFNYSNLKKVNVVQEWTDIHEWSTVYTTRPCVFYLGWDKSSLVDASSPWISLILSSPQNPATIRSWMSPRKQTHRQIMSLKHSLFI